eukprot:363522-Chlamydomonas_euryale.AAC.9
MQHVPCLAAGHALVSLLWHLLDDVGGAEDRLQVQPRGLTLQPVVQHVLQRLQQDLPSRGTLLRAGKSQACNA